MDAAESPAVLSAPALSPPWLTAVLGRPVHSVGVEPMEGGGVSGDLVRLRLHDGSTFVAKRPAVDEAVRERQRALGMYAREAHFYRELAPRLSLRTPRCFFASDDLLVIEDLAPAAAGTFSEGLPMTHVDAVIDAFVAMHGEWQGSEELGRLDWLWRVSDEEARRWQQNLEGRLPRFVDRHRDALTDDDVRAAELVTANLAALMTAAAALPATLCHGDPGAAEPHVRGPWRRAGVRRLAARLRTERCPRPRVVARPRCSDRCVPATSQCLARPVP